MEDLPIVDARASGLRSVMDEIKNLMPTGTAPMLLSAGDKSDTQAWRLAPASPADLFGATAHLLRVSGAMGWFEPSPSQTADSDHIVLTVKERQDIKTIADKWAKSEDVDEIQDLWSELIIANGNECLRPRKLAGDKNGSLKWCKVALKLLLIADLASDGVGRSLQENDTDDRANFIEDLIKLKRKNERSADGIASLSIAESELRRSGRHPASIALRIDTDVACVLPKSRIAQVGCSLRSLSANLALLPSRASVRCHWVEPPSALRADDGSTLDILLIPAPFEIRGTDFKAKAGSEEKAGQWGNFSLNQGWLGESSDILNITRELLRSASKQTRALNAIMFPEYALDWETFNRICSMAWKEIPELEFIIAGSSENCERHPGNHVLTAIRHESIESDKKQWISAVSRRKHHRWRLDSNQISDYALASSLNPATACWWESHDIFTPELYFHRFRQSSTFVTMICEDLARSEPCHEIIKSIGPNLVFALLMDGPQLPSRWGARYASSLADDPGCSVMTFTSWGLIRRMNANGKFPESRSIGLWKDETGCVEQILMPKGDNPSGVLVSLAGKTTRDWTIDGRAINNWSWRFHGQQPVTLKSPVK